MRRFVPSVMSLDSRIAPSGGAGLPPEIILPTVPPPIPALVAPTTPVAGPLDSQEYMDEIPVTLPPIVPPDGYPG